MKRLILFFLVLVSACGNDDGKKFSDGTINLRSNSTSAPTLFNRIDPAALAQANLTLLESGLSRIEMARFPSPWPPMNLASLTKVMTCLKLGRSCTKVRLTRIQGDQIRLEFSDESEKFEAQINLALTQLTWLNQEQQKIELRERSSHRFDIKIAEESFSWNLETHQLCSEFECVEAP